MDKIFLRGMDFYAYHGVMPEEKILGQRFLVDLVLELSLREAGLSDDLTKTVHYGEVYSTVKNIVLEHKYNLIEALAERIASEILSSYPVEVVTVKIRKPQAPIPGIFEYAGVEIIRRKDRLPAGN